MSQQAWANHPSNPAAQPFNINGSRNKTKTRAWWQPNSPTYFLNRSKKKEKGGSHE